MPINLLRYTHRCTHTPPSARPRYSIQCHGKHKDTRNTATAPLSSRDYAGFNAMPINLLRYTHTHTHTHTHIDANTPPSSRPRYSIQCQGKHKDPAPGHTGASTHETRETCASLKPHLPNAMGQQYSSGSFSNTMLLPADITKRAIFLQVPENGVTDCNATVHLTNTMGQQCSSGSLSNKMLLPSDTHTKRTAQRIGAHFITKRNEMPHLDYAHLQLSNTATRVKRIIKHTICWLPDTRTIGMVFKIMIRVVKVTLTCQACHPELWEGFQDRDPGRRGYSGMPQVL